MQSARPANMNAAHMLWEVWSR